MIINFRFTSGIHDLEYFTNDTLQKAVAFAVNYIIDEYEDKTGIDISSDNLCVSLPHDDDIYYVEVTNGTVILRESLYDWFQIIDDEK